MSRVGFGGERAMTSLYGRLQRYQSRLGREPLEDFLSEALADLLARMPRSKSTALAAVWFFAAGPDRAAWLIRSRAAKVLSWRTQVWVEHGQYRMDMLASADDRPLLAIETKIAADYQRHKKTGTDPAASSGGDETQTQLHSYGQWIAAIQPDAAWAGALGLITFGREPPQGFEDPNDTAYGVTCRRVIRWSTVWKTLNAEAEAAAENEADDPGIRPAWIELALQLCQFLEEKHMAFETMTSADYALMELYLPVHARLKPTFDRFWFAVQQFHAACGLQDKRPRKMKVETDGSLVWGWFYLKPDLVPDGGWSYVAWGLRFPAPDGEAWFSDATPGLDDVPAVFVAWSNEAQYEQPTPPDGWSVAPEAEMIVTAPLGAFAADDPDARAAKMGAWMLGQMRALEPALRASKASGRKWKAKAGGGAADDDDEDDES